MKVFIGGSKTISDIDVTEVIPNDFVFTFDNGTVLQVYSMVQKNTPLIEIR